MWRFESVHGFASVGNLYQKMHFAGSNLSTDPNSSAVYSPTAKVPAPYALQASLQISGRGTRTDAAPRGFAALTKVGAIPASRKGTPFGVPFLLCCVSDLDAKPCVADLDARRFCRGYTNPLPMMGVKSIRDLPDF